MKRELNAAALKSFVSGFRDLDSNETDEVCGQLEDLGSFLDEEIVYRDLPVMIPEQVRRTLVAHSKQMQALSDKIQGVLEQLSIAAHKVLTEKEKEEDNRKARCKTCGQILPPVKERSRR
jgi:hypothetical protein